MLGITHKTHIMFILNKEEEEEASVILDKMIADGGQHYVVTKDLQKGVITVSRRSLKDTKRYKVICVVDLDLSLPQKEWYKKVKKEIDSALRGYAKLYYFSRAAVCRQLHVGPKKIEFAFVREVVNPHYKCAASMKLYDANILRYHMGDKYVHLVRDGVFWP